MRNQKEVERRVKVLTFWKTYGDKATKDAFGVSRRTLFRWQAALANSRGNLASLDPKSKAPHKRRARHIPGKASKEAENEKLVDWLLRYNTVRPHESLGLVSPLRYITSTLSEQECQKYWTRTGH